MKNRFGITLLAIAFISGSGFLKKNEDGSTSLDTASLTKAAADATAQTESMSQQAMEKIKAAAAKIEVKPEEILADLAKPAEEIKQKVAGMDAANLMAYVNQYSNVFKDTQGQITDYAEQVKSLKFTEAFSAKGKELKSQLSTYTDQLSGLKEQCSHYVTALKGYGIDPAAFGMDLSAYGL